MMADNLNTQSKAAHSVAGIHPVFKKLVFVVLILLLSGLLSACQTATPPPQTKPASAPNSAASPAPSTDIVGNLIAELEDSSGNTALQRQSNVAPAEEVTNTAIGQAGRVDAGQQKRAELAEQALKAALSLLKDKESDSISVPPTFVMPVKSEGQLRIGLMLPFSGDYAELGRDIASGVELALFQLGDPNAELMYFDTEGGARASEAARQAVAAEVDIVIGPLFTQSVLQSRTIFAASAIPTLSLSNNIQAASPGHWILGYLPEQQIDHLLGFAIAQNYSRIAILASEDTFGQRLSSHTANRLASFGLRPAEQTILPQEVLEDETLLKQAIQRFTRYQKTSAESQNLPAPAYDGLVLAGNSEFILRVAPLIAYYDMDPSRVVFLGTDLWTRPELLNEPSLQGAMITQAILPENTDFETRFQGLFNKPSNHLVRLGFDAFALVAITHQKAKTTLEKAPTDWRAQLIRTEGFEGLSGRFNLLPDGQNQRFYEIRKLQDNKLLPR